MKLYLALIFLCLLIPMTECENIEEKQIAECAKKFRINDEYAMSVFEKNPSKACFYLLQELRPLDITHIVGYKKESGKYNKELHVIDCIRALRALTGKKFYSATNYKFGEGEEEENRQDFLFRNNKNEVPFFANWMSRDSEFIAPSDAQKSIIKKWHEWYEKEGARYNYRKNYKANFDDFYF